MINKDLRGRNLPLRCKINKKIILEEFGLNSMTGYGSATVASDGREITLELKSVNHRFLDINIRSPRILMFAEEELRKAIGNYIARGHVEVNVTYRNTREDAKLITVDKALVMQYANAFKKVAENYKELLADDPGDPEMLGGWHRIDHKKKVGDK